jgi:hypothetical protein
VVGGLAHVQGSEHINRREVVAGARGGEIQRAPSPSTRTGARQRFRLTQVTANVRFVRLGIDTVRSAKRTVCKQTKYTEAATPPRVPCMIEVCPDSSGDDEGGQRPSPVASGVT